MTLKGANINLNNIISAIFLVFAYGQAEKHHENNLA